MASWRVKGYVSDSEDEDGGVFVTNPAPRGERSPTLSKIPAAASTSGESETEHTQAVQAVQDQNERLGGTDGGPSSHALTTSNGEAALYTAEEIRQSLQQISSFAESTSPRPATSKVQNELEDDDSPLSSPPDSPQSLPSITKVIAGEGGFPVAEESVPITAPQRNFRQRTANQLQPYTIDQAKHMQEWAALGIKPVPLQRSRSPVTGPTKPVTEDSQFDESQSQLRDSNSQDLMDLDISPQSPQPARRNKYDVIMEDELPDLTRLLERRSPRSVKPSRRSMVLFDVPSSGSEQQFDHIRRKPSIQFEQQDSLPSPPPSLTDHLPRALDLVESQEQENAPLLMPSSTPRPRKRLIVEDDTQSADEAQIPTPVPVVQIPDDTSSEGSASGNEMVQVMQKKIKGVLPASWWTVEMAQKSLAEKKKQISRQHTPRALHAGVAQRKSIAHKDLRPARNRDLDELASNQASEDEVPVTAAPVRIALSSHFSHETSQDEIDDMDVVVENEIDYMLAPQSRRRGPSTKSHAESKILNVTRAKPQARRQKQHSLGGLAPNRQPKRVKARTTRERVHVLDAPDLISPKQKLPTFLRVAARQARSKSRSSGTLVSRKFFHLDSDDESAAQKIDPASLLALHSHRNSELSVTKGHHEDAKPKSNIGSAKFQSDRNDRIGQDSGQPLPSDAANTNDTGATLGYLIQCGSTDDAALRLTRLQSLLPLTNRSGHGRFASHHLQPRDAQIEILKPPSRLPVRSPHRKIVAAQYAKAAQSDPWQSTTTDQRPQNDRTTLNDRRKRKQAPVQKPKLHQTSLVAPSPDTENLTHLIGKVDPVVRETLEREFNKHQAAWFQASHQDIVHSNQDTQQHFYVFLDVLKSYLPVALQEAEDERESRELRSFIHRLIPNRGQIGASGQVGNKIQSVHKYDILVAQNVFELHKCLLSLAPGAAPRPRVLEMKVNFLDAHEEICLVALSTWKGICRLHIGDLEIVRGLSGWLYSMLSQLAHRWIAAETDAQKDAAVSTRLINADVIRRVVEHNRDRVCSLFCKALTDYTDCIRESTSVLEARTMFGINDFAQFISQLSNLDRINPSVIEGIFAVADAYVSPTWMSMERAEISQLVEALRKSLVILASTQHLLHVSAYALTKLFFTVAEQAADRGLISWDELLVPSSPKSFDQTCLKQNVSTIKAVFCHLIIERGKLQYEPDLRSTIITFWVLALLTAKEHDQYWKLLTRSILRHEPDSLHLSSLATRFGSLDDIDATLLDDISISELRHAVVLHIIAVLHEREQNVNADRQARGFEKGDADNLLRSMFYTMRETWQSLRDDPEQQDVYTLLIHAALQQFGLHPRQDLPIDPWFRNAATFPQPVQNDLFQILGGYAGPDVDSVEKARDLFDLEVEQAGRFDRFGELEAKLHDALLQRNQGGARGWTTCLLVEQGTFFRLTLGRFANDSSIYTTAATEVLVRVLLHLMENLHCCPGADDQSSLQKFMLNILPLLSALRSWLIEAPASFKANVFDLTRLIYSWTMACLGDVPDDSMVDLEAICDLASETVDSLPQSSLLLETIMTMGQTISG